MRKKNLNIYRKESKFFLFFFFTLTLSFLFFLIFLTARIEKKKKEFEINLRELKDKVTELEERKNFLQNQIQKIQKESFWEEKIRQEGYVKEGENLVVILNPQTSLPPKINRENLIQENRKNFLEKIKEKISKIFNY
jgi:cell division protein FtsB